MHLSYNYIVDRLKQIKRLPQWGLYALLIYMPFHVFLAQSLSLATGGLPVWKIAKDVITVLLTAFIVVLVWLRHKNTPEFTRFLILAVVYGLIHLLLWALHPDIYRQSAILGTVYNNRLLWYLLIGMGTGLLWPKVVQHRQVLRIMVLVSTIVCVLGVLQYFLPKGLLTHLGYSLSRGVRPAFFIDDKPDLPRIMSTLRDPNSLGAYLILPITLLAYKLIHTQAKRRTLLLGLLTLHGLALLLTFSRSAWLGTVLSGTVLLMYEFKGKLKPWVAKFWPLIIGVILLVGSLTMLFRNQYAVQNILVHSDESTAAKSTHDSNGYHLLLIKKGLDGVAKEPLGHGPGTAGIVSIQNPKGGFLTENYYVQIAYEVGILGLVVFLAVHYYVYKNLRQKPGPLAVCLVASFWGYVLVNMLLHIWSNEAVAAQWWILVGLALITNRTVTPKRV